MDLGHLASAAAMPGRSESVDDPSSAGMLPPIGSVPVRRPQPGSSGSLDVRGGAWPRCIRLVAHWIRHRSKGQGAAAAARRDIFRAAACQTRSRIRQLSEVPVMAVQLNHTIVHARDSRASAQFVAEIPGLPRPGRFGPFQVVELANGVSLDFVDTDGEIAPQHYAFLISEAEFDQIFERVRERNIPHWADPGRTRAGRVNHGDRGRGVHFDGPDGHFSRDHHPAVRRHMSDAAGGEFPASSERSQHRRMVLETAGWRSHSN